MTDLHTLHDAGVIIPPRDSLAHSLADEVYAPRPSIEPIVGGWREVGEILAGLVIFGALFVGIPFLLWLVAA